MADVGANKDDEKRLIPIHQSAIKPRLPMGAELNLVILSAMFCALVALPMFNATGNVLFLGLGLAMWLVVIGFLRAMAKEDPVMSIVAFHHFKIHLASRGLRIRMVWRLRPQPDYAARTPRVPKGR